MVRMTLSRKLPRGPLSYLDIRDSAFALRVVSDILWSGCLGSR